MLEAGDEILAVLDPTVEEDLTAYFGPDGDRATTVSATVEFLIVGGGLAAALLRLGAAQAGRRGLDPARRPRARAAYERPPLSKEYLRGEASREDAYVNPADWYEENDVELRTRTNVMSLDPEARTAKLQGGEEVEFEKALLATGANVNILRVEGAELEGIHYLRAFGNSDAIREEAARGRARGADRRQLHRLRGGGLADRDGRRSARS